MDETLKEVLIAVPALFFIFMLIRMRMKNKHEIMKLEAQSKAVGSDLSVTPNELEGMIQRSVQEALSETNARMRELERVERPQLPPQ